MITRSILFSLLMGSCLLAQAQDQSPPTTDEQPKEAPSAVDQVKESTDKLANQAAQEMSKVADVVDKDPRAGKVAAGILQPIYQFAESLSFPMFHWVAFALMSAGVVSYTLQLVLGKLVVLSKMGFSPKEIVSDAAGLAISLVGLVLTTQAAAENSTFTHSPASVLSSAALGLIVGFILYRWGQAQELQAVAGRVVETKVKKT